MRYEMIVMDMDGTLLDPSSKLTERTRRALLAAGEAGAGVVLASGRMPCALRQFVKALNLTSPLISYNGAVIADPVTEEELSGFPIPAALAREAAAFCESLGFHIQAYRGDAFCCREANVFAQDYQAFLNCPVRLEAVGVNLSEYLDFDTPKLLGIDTPERVAEILPVIRGHFEGRLKVATSQPRFIEFISPSAGKAAALEKLCAITGTPREKVAAFGDGLNDLDMLEWAGHSVAMANAHPKLLECADEIAPSNAEDGVAQVVEKMLSDGTLGGNRRG